MLYSTLGLVTLSLAVAIYFAVLYQLERKRAIKREDYLLLLYKSRTVGEFADATKTLEVKPPKVIEPEPVVIDPELGIPLI